MKQERSMGYSLRETRTWGVGATARVSVADAFGQGQYGPRVRIGGVSPLSPLAGRGEREVQRAKKEGALGDRRRAPFSVGKSWCLVLGVDGAGAWSDRARQGGAASEAGTLTTRWCSPRRVRLGLPGSGKRP